MFLKYELAVAEVYVGVILEQISLYPMVSVVIAGTFMTKPALTGSGTVPETISVNWLSSPTKYRRKMPDSFTKNAC